MLLTNKKTPIKIKWCYELTQPMNQDPPPMPYEIRRILVEEVLKNEEKSL